MRISILLIIILSIISCSESNHEIAFQTGVITNFYKIVLSLKSGGIPGPRDTECLAPYISVEFKSLLLKAHNAEMLYSRKTKNQVPPLVEGSFFFSLFEGASRVKSIKIEAGNVAISYTVTLEYTDLLSKNEKVIWNDRVILILENGRWVIQDIELPGDWQFGRKGSGTDILRSVIKNADDEPWQ